MQSDPERSTRASGPAGSRRWDRIDLPPESLATLEPHWGDRALAALTAAFAVALSRFMDLAEATLFLDVGDDGASGGKARSAHALDLGGRATFDDLLAQIRRQGRPPVAFNTATLATCVGWVEDPRADAEPAVDGRTDNPEPNLCLAIRRRGGRLLGGFDVDRRAVDAETVSRISRCLGALLASAHAGPRRPVATLALASPDQRRQLVVAWNQTAAAYPEDRRLHQLFETQARRAPDATAQSCGERVLTYAALNRRANLLARRLRAHGVGPETLTALFAPRSLEATVGILATLKAGGAYVPLDPTYPRERIAYMLDQVRAPVVLTLRALTGRLPHSGAKTLILDETDPPARAGVVAEDAGAAATSDSAAYIIFTSGSTGRPKGVLGLHRGMVNRLAWYWRTFPFEAGETACLRTSLSFVDAVGELFAPLAHGVPAEVVDDATARDPILFADRLRRRRVTRMTLTPTLLRMMLAALGDFRARLPRLKHWFSSGEALPLDLERLFFARADGDLYNLYGPSEASMETTYWRCARDHSRSTVPIGRPLANARNYVLDAALNPVPVGVIGELFMAGPCLARGYLGQPGLTADVFIADPFAAVPGERMYRSGDLVRRTADGVIEYLGRRDAQVKIRGHRIEPGEIEATLRDCPGVAEAAVAARENRAGFTQLAAYVAASAATVEIAGVRAFLAGRLPAFMVPALITVLDALPKTGSGKLDRRALPEPAVDEPETDMPAADGDTARIAAIFAEVLGRSRVGPDQSFFHLGGDSLMAVQVMSRLREAFSVEAPLRAFYEAPTAARLGRFIDSAERVDAPPPIRPAASNRPAPLSFAQERLWFLCHMEGGDAYAIPQAYRLAGALDPAALTRAVNEIVRRHEILRTRFPADAGVAVQAIGPFEPAALPRHDLAGLPESAREQALNRLLRAQRRLAFDLARGPLWRASLIRLTPDLHVLAFVFHHMVFDGWSIDVLEQELAVLYEAFSNGKPAGLAEPGVQYADYARWQRDWLAGPQTQKHVAYWTERLAGAPPLLEFPLDRPRPPVQSYRGAVSRFFIPPELTASLTALGRQTDASLFMVLLAGYAALLSRYSGQSDLCLGAPIANRARPQLEPMIGLFVNTLALRIEIGADAGLGALIGQARRVALEAYDRQDLPFEEVVRVLRPERNLSHAPLFQAMFALDGPAEPFAMGGLTATPEEASTEHALFDFSLAITPAEGGLRGVFEYSRDLFEDGAFQRLGRHYRRLLEAATADPDRPLGRFALLDRDERRLLEIEWNRTDADDGPRLFTPELFRSQAMRRPAATAVVSGEERVGFGALYAGATRLARRLRARGVGPECVVGICLNRSAALVEAVLATLGAGGAYLPLDPDYPTERLEFMLDDARVELLITDGELVDRIPARTGAVVLIDAREPETTAAGDWPADAARPDNPAYVIYTSGSTGRPKGVVISRRNLAEAYRAWDRAYGLAGRCQSHLQMASFSFDVFSGDLTRSMCSGAKLTLASRDQILSPQTLYGLMRTESIDCVDFAPPVIRRLAQYLASAGRDLRFLKLMVLGTDAWNVSEFRQWRALCGPQTRFLNAYGVTEATVASAYYEEGRLKLPAEGLVPIGVPLPNETLYILDGHGRSAPIGVAGELYIGGAGVARGYLGRPALTAWKFAPDPFSGQNGARLYRTGDVARRLADGNIDFLGRRDNQVKIRGFRIELGEIEGVLAKHPAAREAVVLARTDAGGDKSLVAYIVPKGEDPPSPGQLREFLLKQLPAYMAPSAYMSLDALPLTPNGKVDRKALIARAARLAPPETAFVPPRVPQEQALAAIWRELLDQPRIGIHDDFFELGGHSLLATQVASRVQDAFSVTLPVRALFEETTVAKLAGRIMRLRGESDAGPPPLKLYPREGDAPLSFAQQRLWFLHQLEGMGSAYNMLTPLRLEGPLDTDALEEALAALVDRHEALRTVFPMVDGAAVQRVAPQRPPRLGAVDLTGLAPEDRRAARDRAAVAEADRPFDLARDILIRASLLRAAPGSHVLLLTVHHIVSDGWSAGVMVRELGALYAARVRGAPSPLPPLAVQYADFARWQREWLDEPTLQEQTRYWARQLAGMPPLLELPTDRPRPPAQSYRGRTEWLAWDSGLRSALADLGARFGSSLFMTLLTGYAATLSRYSGQKDICVGSPIANRGRAEIEGLIGFFVNSLALRVRLEGAPRFSDLIKRVRETCLEAYDHQDLPFERLVQTLAPERDLSRAPLFQVMFALQNAPFEDLRLAGLSLAKMDIPNATAKFDMILSIEETADGLALELEYNTDLFDRDTARRFAASYQTLMRAAVADPDADTSRLPLLTPAERNVLVNEWNRGATPFAEPAPVHRSVERQASLNPSRPAATMTVDGSEIALTYAELDARANGLAHRLRRLGVGPETPVGLCLERGPTMAVAVLAALKAGGGYVPLDPEYPRERLRFMLEDSRALWVLVQRETADRAGAAQAVVLDEARLAGERRAAPPEVEVGGDNLAYITYTSGSTGKPKGIAMPHGPVANLIAWHRAAAARPAMTTLQFAPLSFDVSFQELFAAWTDGGTLVLVANPERRDPFRLLALLRSRSVQRLFLPTAALQPLAMAAAATEPPNALLEVWVGGEQMRITDEIKGLFRRLESCRLINYYGPSECHAVTAFPLPEDIAAWPAAPPIGKPIANARLYLLDAHREPIPIGVCGELYIGGPCVGRGYVNLSDQTRAAFVADPFIDDSAARMYRTGDLARHRPDGQIEFLGRIDGQVKIRGFRIELGEIESALSRHEKVEAAVVVATGDAGAARLAAYVSPKPGVAVDPGELETFLLERAPEYMVPASWTVLDAFPLTANGKIDRSALPAPGEPVSAGRGAPPRDSLEQALAGIWEDVLGAGPISVDDNFFELGGHSILAMSLMVRIQKWAGAQVPVEWLFQGPTIAQLAEKLRRRGAGPAWSCLVAIGGQGDKPPLFLVHPAGGNVFCYAELSRHLSRPLYGFQSPGLDPGQEPLRRIEDMASRYLGELRSVQPEGPYCLGGWSLGGVVAYEMAQRLTAMGQEVGLLALIDSTAPQEGGQADLVDAALATALARDLGGLFGEDYRVPADQLASMAPDARLDFILDWAKTAEVLPPDMTPAQLRRLLTVFEKNLEGLFHYQPQPYDGAVVTIAASERDAADATLGWSATATCEAYEIPGDHYAILRPPGVRRLAEILSRKLGDPAP